MKGTRSQVAFVAAPYGFGPVAKAIAIASYLSPKIATVFLGAGPSLALAKESLAFEHLIEIPFNSDYITTKELLDCFRCIVFVNTERFISATRSEYSTQVFVDTLGWLRAIPPQGLRKKDFYLAQAFFNNEEPPANPKSRSIRWIEAILPRQTVEEILETRTVIRDRTPDEMPLMHLGGLHSPMMQEGADKLYLEMTLDTVYRLGFSCRVLIPEYLTAEIGSKVSKFAIPVCANPTTIARLISKSSYVVTVPGIEFVYESALARKPIVFLSPYNGTQAIQLIQYERLGLGYLPFSIRKSGSAAGLRDLHDKTSFTQCNGGAGKWKADQEAALRFALSKTLDSEFQRSGDHNYDIAARVGFLGAIQVAELIDRLVSAEECN